MNSICSTFEKPEELPGSGSECSRISSITILSLYRVLSDPRDFTLPRRTQPSPVSSAPSLPVCTPTATVIRIDNKTAPPHRCFGEFHSPLVDRKEDNDSSSPETAVQPSRKGAWTKEEDARLLEAMKIVHNTDYWKSSACFVGTRSPKQCRYHWYNTLDPEIKLPKEWYA